MSLNINDIVALSKAGFTAEQIAKMNQVPQPAQTETPAIKTQPEKPAEQIIQQQIVEQPVQQVVQTTQQAKPVTDIEKLMAQVQQLTETVQANAVNTSNIPQNIDSTEDILASIIDPVGVKMKKGGNK